MTTSDPVLDRGAAGRSPGAMTRSGLLAVDLAAVPAATVVALTVGLSAFLLFTVEPLVGRLALPAFGGSPGVWAAVLAFFQAVLLAGYLYGHLSVTHLGLRRGALVHLGLAAAALASLVIAPSLPLILALLLLFDVLVGVLVFGVLVQYLGLQRTSVTTDILQRLRG